MARRKQVERLLAKPKQDEYVLDRTLADNEAPLEVFGFHAQQAAEKMLKPVLIAGRVACPRTHRLAELIDLLLARGLNVPRGFEELRHLTPFAVEYRYDAVFDDDATPLDKPAIRRLIHDVRAWTLRTTADLLADSP